MEMWFVRWYRHDDPTATKTGIDDRDVFNSLEEAAEAALKPKLVPYDEKYGDEYNVFPKGQGNPDQWKGLPDKYMVHANEKGEQVVLGLTMHDEKDTTYPFLHLLECIRDEHCFDYYYGPYSITGDKMWRGYTFHRLSLSKPVIEAAMQKTTARASNVDEGAKGEKRDGFESESRRRKKRRG